MQRTCIIFRQTSPLYIFIRRFRMSTGPNIPSSYSMRLQCEIFFFGCIFDGAVKVMAYKKATVVVHLTLFSSYPFPNCMKPKLPSNG
jgi:hypothetical protein